MRHICATHAPEVRHCGPNFSAVPTAHLWPCLPLGLIVGGIGANQSDEQAAGDL
jgi:hypothetical protein